MATATTPTETLPAASSVPMGLRPYRMTLDVYERLVASGAFGDKARVFLWKGHLVEKVADMTKNPPHVVAVNALDGLLSDLMRGRGHFVEQDQPLALDDSMPEPDLKCVRGCIRDYTDRRPTPDDCPLVVEVAETSLRDDRGEMLRGYAAAGVSVYWIVNLVDHCLEVYTGPTGSGAAPGYRSRLDFGPDDQVPVVLDGREVGRIAVRDVLP